MTPVSLPTINSLLWEPDFGALKIPILDQSSQYRSFWEQHPTQAWEKWFLVSWLQHISKSNPTFFLSFILYSVSPWRQRWRTGGAAHPWERSSGPQWSRPSRCGRCKLRSSTASDRQLWSRWASGHPRTRCRTRWFHPCSSGKHQPLGLPSQSRTSDCGNIWSMNLTVH